MNKTLKITFLAVAVAALLVLPSAAFANSTQEAYGGPNNVVAGLDDTGGPDSGDDAPAPVVESVTETSDAAPASSSGTLPFTGADLGVLAAVGALMLLFGFGLRRVTRHTSQP